MSNIQNWLAQIKSARYGKDVRESIYNSISFLNNIASAAQNSASASASSAKASATSASSSASSAKASAALAEQYKNDAFAGTPEGYAELVEDVRLMDIQTTTDTTLSNSKAGGYKLVSMSGNSVQNGTPSTDNKQAIHNTGDCVEMIQGTYDMSSGAFAQSAYGLCSKNIIPCKGGDTIVLSTENATGYRLLFLNDNTIVSAHSSGNEQLTNASYTAPSGANNFKFHFYNTSVAPTYDTVGKISLTINGKYVVQFKNVNPNLVVLPDVESTTSAGITWSCKDGVVKAKGTSTAISWTKTTIYYDMPIVAGNYYVSGSSGSVSVYVQIDKADGTTSYARNTSFTLDGTEKQARLYLHINSGYTVDEVCYPMVNKGTIALPWVQHKESVATILLNEPLRDGDILYKEDGLFKVERHKASVVLDDSASWTSYATVTSGKYRMAIPTALDNVKIVANNMAANIVCTVAPTLSADDIYLTKEGCGINIQGSFIFYNENYNTSDIRPWTSYLAENPITVEYELAEPTIETLDTDSQIALNSLETFDTVTHIIVDSRVQTSEIKGEYGTSQVGARTLKNELRNDTLEIKYNELAVAFVATESGV